MRASSVFVSAVAASAAARGVSARADASFSFSSALAMSSEAAFDLVSNWAMSLASFCLSLPVCHCVTSVASTRHDGAHRDAIDAWGLVSYATVDAVLRTPAIDP